MEKASTAPSVEQDISLKAEVRPDSVEEGKANDVAAKVSRRTSRARRLPCVCFQCMKDSNSQDLPLSEYSHASI